LAGGSRFYSTFVFIVAKPKELAAMIMKNDKKWNPAKIETAMNSGEEYWYTLKNKIHTLVISPLVGNADGVVHFYEDVYKRSISILIV
jgi:murein L,D-transpeptidase YcbB/YkuD